MHVSAVKQTRDDAYLIRHHQRSVQGGCHNAIEIKIARNARFIVRTSKNEDMRRSLRANYIPSCREMVQARLACLESNYAKRTKKSDFQSNIVGLV